MKTDMHMFYIYITMLLTATSTTEKIPIYIGGFFPMTRSGTTGWIGGPSTLPAVEMAIELINNRTDILPEYDLHLIWNDTKNEASVGMHILYEFIYNEPKKIMLVGPALSRIAVPLSETATVWNLVQMSFSARSTELSDKDRFPLFFRTVPDGDAFNPARLKMFEQFGWKRIAVLYEQHPGDIYSSTSKKLIDMLSEHNYTIVSVQSVGADPQMALETIKNEDARIIVASFYYNTAIRVFCEAYRLGLYGGQYVWILLGWVASESWPSKKIDGVNCTTEEMLEATEGHFITEYQKMTETTESISGMTSAIFEERFSSRTPWLSSYSYFAFDAMCSISLALNATRRDGFLLEDFSYDNKTYSDVIRKHLQTLTFAGITGNVAFDTDGNRMATISISQSQGSQRVEVARYDPLTDSLKLVDGNVVLWQGGKVPLDAVIKKIIFMYIEDRWYILLCIIAGIGIALSMGAMCYNIRHRNLKYIKLSSPYMNNIIACGCMLAYVSVFLFGLDGRHLEPDLFSANCRIRTWVLVISFTLAFGTMFSKTWRVYLIMSNTTLEKKVVTDWMLGFKIVILLIIDLIFLTVWTSFDAPTRHIVQFAEQVDPNNIDHITLPRLEVCSSKYGVYWIGCLLVYKGLLLLFGLFLAWCTRNVRVQALNDSRYISFAVYNVSLVCLVAVPVSYLTINDNYQGAYIIKCVFIIFATSMTLCLVFGPKVIELHHNPKGLVSFNLKKTNCSSNRQVVPMEQIQENISIQRRLEIIIAQKEQTITELRETLENMQPLDFTNSTSRKTLTSTHCTNVST